MTALYALTFLTVAALFVRRRSGVDGLASPVSVLAFSTAFYAVVVPFELWLRRDPVIGFTGEAMAPVVGQRVVLAASVGFVAFAAGYAIIAPRSRSIDLVGNDRGVSAAIRVAALATAIGAALLATVFRENVLLANDYLSNVAQTALGTDAVAYFVVNRWTYLSYGLFCFLFIARARRAVRALLLLAPLVGWAVYSNDKDPLLVAALASAGLLYSRLRLRAAVRGVTVALAMVVALAGMGLGAATFGTQRAGGSVGGQVVSTSLHQGLFINIDPAGPAVVLTKTLGSPAGEGSFRPALTGLVSWLPSPIRPIQSNEDLAITFAKANWENWRPGYGFGYSPLAEGWQAFGYLGIILLMLGAGAIFGTVRNVLIGEAGNNSGASAVGIAGYHIVLGYLAFIFMRSTFASLISTAAICLILLLGLSVGANALARISRSVGKSGVA